MIIIDSVVGNLASIYNMLKQIGLTPKISHNYDEISKSPNIILPGVGNFKKGMETIKEKKIDKAIKNAAQNNSKILGICTFFLKKVRKVMKKDLVCCKEK